MNQMYYNLLNLINALKATVDGLSGGSGTEIKRQTVNVSDMINLQDWTGQWVIATDDGVQAITGNAVNKTTIKFKFVSSGSVNVDVRLVNGVSTVQTYNDGFSDVNIEASYVIPSGTTYHTLITDKIINVTDGTLLIEIKTNNANLTDTFDIFVESQVVELNSLANDSSSIPAGI
jgi:hypothetical protein